MKKLLLLLLVFCSKLHAQTTGINLAKYTFDYHGMVPKMPENSSFETYGNIPISTAKGIANVNFNFHTLSKGGVDVPIGISYLSTGVRVNSIPSSIGVNWSLNAGGSIDRTINGLADEDFIMNDLNFINPVFITNQNGRVDYKSVQDSMRHMGELYYDCTLDYFNYNFPGYNGSMYMDKTGKFRVDKDFKKLKVDFKKDIHGLQFSFKDLSGNTYIFKGAYDGSVVYQGGKFTIQSSSMTSIVSLKLAQIITATKESIYFEYNNIAYYEYTSLNSERFVRNARPCNVPYTHDCSGFVSPCDDYSFQTSSFQNNAALITRIYTDDQEVIFNYRTDASLAIFKKKIASIKIYSRISQDTVKRIYFSHTGDYLTQYQELSSDNNVRKKTTFVYNGYGNTDPYSFDRDMYGYNIGHTGATNLMADSGAASYGYILPITNRRSNAFATHGALTEIIYPTGGKTIFEYDNNTDTVGGTVYYAPGIRVKSIVDFDTYNKQYNRKTFYYNQLRNGRTYNELTFNSTEGTDIFTVKVYDSESKYDGSGFYYADVRTENVGTAVSPTQKQVTIDYYGDQIDLFEKTSPILLKRETYTNNGLDLLSSEEYRYKLTFFDSFYTRSYVLRQPKVVFGVMTYPDVSGIPDIICPPEAFYTGYDARYNLQPIVYELDTLVSKTFSSSGENITVVNSYTYNQYGLIQSVKTTGSDNISRSEQYLYANDYAGSVHNQMKDSFLLAPIIKEQYFLGTAPARVSKERTFVFKTGLFNLSKETLIDGPTGKTVENNFLGYNNKQKLLSREAESNIKTTYIWDYLEEYPIAEVINADTLSVAHTSFEADGKGRFVFTGSPVSDNTAVTGKKVYTLSTGAITRGSLTSDNTYFITYWSKSGSGSITGTVAGWPKALRAINRNGQTWTLYEHKITGITSVTISGSIVIDELRLYPENAQMKTFTYKPLIGISSQCDANSNITNYEYDSFNRLAFVRDESGNILKRVCYNYAGEIEDCGMASTSPQWESTGLTRCQPCPANSAYTSNVQEHQEKDNNPNSPTYNTYRWISDGVNSNCIPQADWQNTATAIRCKKDGSNQNTGEQEREQRDMNPCSSTYNQLRWTITGTNLTACPLPAACNSSNCYGEDKKCVNGVCETGLKVYTLSYFDGQEWTCVYHYEWSDSSWSSNYTEQSSTGCPIW